VNDQGAELKMVVGLGNPGAKYEGTRHNIGFEVLAKLQSRLGCATPRSKFEGQFTTSNHESANYILVWPLTYMNNSGRCVQAMANFYKVNCEQNLLVVCDDLSLPLGKLRMRASGSAGGQKGLNDILRACGTQAVARLRVGIDPPPPQWDAADYVLGRFREDERKIVDEVVNQAADAVVNWATRGIAFCMNKING
jgi:peptidyl-tRNA hydrolase, PTH1 family